jgi:hypothetical protein
LRIRPFDLCFQSLTTCHLAQRTPRKAHLFVRPSKLEGDNISDAT